MRRPKIYPYVFLALSLFALLNFSKTAMDAIRSRAVGIASPMWRTCFYVREKTSGLLSFRPFSGANSEPFLKKIEELKGENRILKTQLDNLRHWILNEDRIEEQTARLKIIDPSESQEKWKEFFQRRRLQLAQILKLQSKGLPSKVIYREPSSWSSFIWLDTGNNQNRLLQEIVVAKNSPVVVGNALIGVVEEVYNSRCKVRLITDSNLIPSVRAVRGDMHNQLLLQRTEALAQILRTKKGFFSSTEEETVLLSLLETLASSLSHSRETAYLAKGELYGTGLPLWRTRGQFLKGIGFNYDFPDEEGPGRDLRTGEPFSESDPKGKIALLQEGDLLITAGFDGIFPPGLEVAFVRRVECLKEGASSYEIEAEAVVSHPNDISEVTVLPPLVSSQS